MLLEELAHGPRSAPRIFWSYTQLDASKREFGLNALKFLSSLLEQRTSSCAIYILGSTRRDFSHAWFESADTLINGCYNSLHYLMLIVQIQPSKHLFEENFCGFSHCRSPKIPSQPHTANFPETRVYHRQRATPRLDIHSGPPQISFSAYNRRVPCSGPRKNLSHTSHLQRGNRLHRRSARNSLGRRKTT